MIDFFFFSSRRRHTRLQGDWSSDVCSSDLLAVTNGSQFFGRDLDFVKNAIMELGVQHAFGEDLVLDVALYDQARPAEMVGRLVQLPDPGRGGSTSDFVILANAGFPHTRGIDVTLDQRFSGLFSGA